MKILFVYAPFCTPTVMPYSITYLNSFLRANSEMKSQCIDLNAKFHRMRFPEFYKSVTKIKSIEEFGKVLEEFNNKSREIYAHNHKLILGDKKPEFFRELLKLVLNEKPDIVAFSLVYNSQGPYALALMKELHKMKIKCIVGGPAVNSKVKKYAVALEDEFELIQYLENLKKESYNNAVVDFRKYNKKDYLTKEIIYPLRTCRGCFYRLCVFCTHSLNQKYIDMDLGYLKKTIALNKAKYVFFIDDSITKKRLIEISDVLKKMHVKWWAQLRPTRDLIKSFKTLSNSGLKSVAWGIESGSQLILDKMKKGTNVADIRTVLKASHDNGIINTVFIMFGFPGESKNEFLDTIDFLKENSGSIDLVSTSVFGLQKGSKVYENPKEFGITEIKETERNFLDARVDYTTSTGSDKQKTKRMRTRHMKTIFALNKLPRIFVTFKEQTLLCK
jgi:radical SAM superfamily enzyme YgiQ (UPF0313 family)